MKLTRREFILLAALLVIGLVFGGYQFVYQPIQARIATLQAEKDSVTNQKDLALAEISTLKNYTDRRDKAVAAIATTSTDFLPGLPLASILLYINDTVAANGLQPSTYLVSPASAIQVITTADPNGSIHYPIADLAQQYRDYKASTGGATPTPAPASGTTQADPTRQVGLLSVKLSMVGSYAQCKDFIDRVNGLKRTIVVTRISYVPSGTDTTIDRQFNFEIDLDFYGIDKILPQTDDTFTWNRPDSTGKPYPFVS